MGIPVLSQKEIGVYTTYLKVQRIHHNLPHSYIHRLHRLYTLLNYLSRVVYFHTHPVHRMRRLIPKMHLPQVREFVNS